MPFKPMIGPVKFANLTSCLQNLAPPGVVVEIGVYKGDTLGALATMFPNRKFYGYDTFEGMPPVEARDNYHKKGDFKDTSLEEVQARYTELPNITLVKGCYPKSDYIDPKPVAQAHVDVDIYESTMNALEYLHTRMAPGGKIFCDDAFQASTEGATIAFCEFAVKHNKIIRIAEGTHAFIEY